MCTPHYQEGYFVGINCSIEVPKLTILALDSSHFGDVRMNAYITISYYGMATINVHNLKFDATLLDDT